MYRARHSDYILQGGMDGLNARIFVSELVSPCGIQFEPVTNRLYWADEHGQKIQSSNDQGSNVHTHASTMQRSLF